MTTLAAASVRPWCREAGAGPGVVCLHSNASTSGQWRDLIELMSPEFRMVAPDAYGAGRSADWPSDRTIRLADEVAFIEPLLDAADGPVALVGHSYGGAVALIAAIKQPQRVRALVLYEPTLFSLLDAERPRPNDGDGIRTTVAHAAAALDAGDADTAAAHFIDYWMGAGSWARTPEARKPAIVAAIVNVRRWGHALFGEPVPLAAFATLDVPVLYLFGRRSTASALGVARLLTAVLPRVEVLAFDDLGHMGPLTHPQLVNPAIARFLRSH